MKWTEEHLACTILTGQKEGKRWSMGGGERVIVVLDPVRRRGGHRYYSSFVFLMKILLSTLAVVLAVIVVVWPTLSGSDQRFSLSFASLIVSTSPVSSAVNARYHGIDRDNQPFLITAALAIESVPGQLNLSTPKADITLREGSWLALEADGGQYQYQHDSALLNLEGKVTLVHGDGYQLHTRTARIDLKGTTASGNSPVTGHGLFGTLAGEGFRVLDRGHTIILIGRSRLLFNPRPARFGDMPLLSLP